MGAETFAVALTAQRELAAKGHHRVPVPDLLIASSAQQHGADVVHVDRHYDTLARSRAGVHRGEGVGMTTNDATPRTPRGSIPPPCARASGARTSRSACARRPAARLAA
jgi:hypothetical protein